MKDVTTIENVEKVGTGANIIMSTDDYERMRAQDFENFTKVALAAGAVGYLLTNPTVQEKATEGVCKLIEKVGDKIANWF